MGQKVGKKELAEHLGWARSTLDRRLLSDPGFPVERRGDQSGGWLFEIDDVDRYLGGGTGRETERLVTAAGAGCDKCGAVAEALKGLEEDLAECNRYLVGLQRFIAECIKATGGGPSPSSGAK